MATNIWLAAEDDETEVFFLKRAFKKANLPVEVKFVNDGEEAIAYLEGKGEYADREKHPVPRVLLLDLKMPKVDGFEVLRWRQKKNLKYLPALVLTSSKLDEDLDLAYSLGATSYLIKPSEADDLEYLVRSITDYWHRLNEFPQCREESE